MVDDPINHARGAVGGGAATAGAVEGTDQDRYGISGAAKGGLRNEWEPPDLEVYFSIVGGASGAIGAGGAEYARSISSRWAQLQDLLVRIDAELASERNARQDAQVANF